MSQTPSQKKLAENEVVFRKANEKVQKALEDALKEAEEYGIDAPDTDIPLHLFCECADDKCLERVVLTIAKYNELHPNPATFVILPGHEVAQIEKIIKKTKDYYVVEKYATPKQTDVKLHSKKANLKSNP